MNKTRILLAGVALSMASLAEAVPLIHSAVTTGGAADAAFNAVINSFRSTLGGALNAPGACAPPCTSGRREINWDAVPVGFSSPNAFPGDFFNGTTGVQPNGRIRGATFTTPGTGFRVSASEFSDEAAFGPGEFDAFSQARMFASLGSNITDVTFSLPGSPGVAATVRGMGIVFSDVDYTGSASLEFFDAGGGSLGLFDVAGVFPAADGRNSQGSFSFLGVSFDAGERVARVRIVSGSHGIDGNYVGLDDAVVMDDFIYAEPQAVPEPLTSILLGAGLTGLFVSHRRRALMTR
ncbi:MAG: PEP-CTERM sorting domain-containing protein [Candidatus Accumulibacter sp.]|uniref:PEP-CTERM sorting domain-containing protein n=1 Tax=Accumulibacter sp. TaxID=2053492 RepID=UPI001A36DFBF|nr:PEP-CTERM sorting domain-containing protein [Accumulibacter sp.]MBL8396307.1 PEP-CTERM sorting domain-containing protein [Accumulibacter sp.]